MENGEKMKTVGVNRTPWLMKAEKEARSNTCDVFRWMGTAYNGFLKWRSLSAKRKKGLSFVSSETKTGCG